MDDNGNCEECPGKCHWTDHVNASIVYKTRQVNKKYDVEALKKQYFDGTNQLSNS